MRFGFDCQAVSSAAAVAGSTFNLRVLRGGYRVVSAHRTWPDPERYSHPASHSSDLVPLISLR